MKSLVLTLSIALSTAFTATAAPTRAESPITPTAAPGMHKPGWGARQRLSERQGLATVVDASSQERPLAIPRSKSFRGLGKPGTGVRR